LSFPFEVPFFTLTSLHLFPAHYAEQIFPPPSTPVSLCLPSTFLSSPPTPLPLPRLSQFRIGPRVAVPPPPFSSTPGGEVPRWKPSVGSPQRAVFLDFFVHLTPFALSFPYLPLSFLSRSPSMGFLINLFFRCPLPTGDVQSSIALFPSFPTFVEDGDFLLDPFSAKVLPLFHFSP